VHRKAEKYRNLEWAVTLYNFIHTIARNSGYKNSYYPKMSIYLLHS
jgi:hypothetical protein